MKLATFAAVAILAGAAIANADTIKEYQIEGKCLIFYTDGSITGYKGWAAVPFFPNDNTPANSPKDPNYEKDKAFIVSNYMSRNPKVIFNPRVVATKCNPGSTSIPIALGLGVR